MHPKPNPNPYPNSNPNPNPNPSPNPNPKPTPNPDPDQAAQEEGLTAEGLDVLAIFAVPFGIGALTEHSWPHTQHTPSTTPPTRRRLGAQGPWDTNTGKMPA